MAAGWAGARCRLAWHLQRRQGREPPAGRGRQCAHPPRRGAEAEAGQCRQVGSAAAKIFGASIRGVRGRKNMRGFHLGSGKPPEKARLKKSKHFLVFLEMRDFLSTVPSPRWRAGCRCGKRQRRPNAQPLRGGCCSGLWAKGAGAGRWRMAERGAAAGARFFAGESVANGGNTRARSRSPNRDAQSADASTRSRKPAAAASPQERSGRSGDAAPHRHPARHRGEPRSRKTHGFFSHARFFGGLPAAQMSPNIFAPSHAPNVPEYFCGCTARLPARPASASLPCRRPSACAPRLCLSALPPPVCLRAPPLPRLPVSAGGLLFRVGAGGSLPCRRCKCHASRNPSSAGKKKPLDGETKEGQF